MDEIDAVFQFQIVRLATGEYAATRDTEPAFRMVADTPEAAAAKGKKSLRSYMKNAVYHAARAGERMTGSDFKMWRESLDLTQEVAANFLGVSRITVLNWEHEKAPISRAVQLATMQLSRMAEDGLL